MNNHVSDIMISTFTWIISFIFHDTQYYHLHSINREAEIHSV